MLVSIIWILAKLSAIYKFHKSSSKYFLPLIHQWQKNILKKQMKQLYKFYYLVFLSFAVFSTKIQAQNLVLEGKVIDSQTSQPVSFANVEIWSDDKKAVAGTVTDEKGSFTFKSLILEKGIIKVRFVGYETFQQAFYADNKKSISFPTFRLKKKKKKKKKKYSALI
eukprot:Opistho-1_new@3846